MITRTRIRIFLFATGMVFWELAWAMSAAGAPQAPKREPFGLKYELRPGLQIITFHTQQGQVRVTLPDPILAGQAFSGTAEAILEGASTATSIYIVELGQQQAVVKNRALRFTAPAEAGLVPLILRDFRKDEIARFALAISSRDAAPRGAGGKWKADGFWVPDLIESTAAIPLLGPFDGNSATTGFKLGGVVCEVVTEVPGRAMAQCRDFRGAPTVKPGVVRYEITKSGTKAEGETRAVALQLSGVPTELANGKFVKMRLVLSGLAGIARDAEIKIENFTPTVVILDRDPPINYFPHNLEYFFIHPKDVKADGTYVTERSLMGIQHGDPIEIRANLVIPTTPHEAVEQILRTPRSNLSKGPGVEHTEALAPFGDDMFPLVAEFLTDGELAWAAEDVLLADRAKAAPLVFAAIPKMSGQPLGIAMERYRRWAEQDLAFPYKRELHDAARDLLERGGGGTEAIFALATVGTNADMPALEKVYQEQKALEAEGKGNYVIMNAAEAVLGRLGSAEHIANIKTRLSMVVKTSADAEVFMRAANDAQFVGREEFVPILCGHLKDPSWWFGDYGYSPASSAAVAINAIAKANNKTPSEIMTDCPKQ